jgi:hypothetical protein
LASVLLIPLFFENVLSICKKGHGLVSTAPRIGPLKSIVNGLADKVLSREAVIFLTYLKARVFLALMSVFTGCP